MLEPAGDWKHNENGVQPTSIAGNLGEGCPVKCRLVIDYSAVNAYTELDLRPVLLLQDAGLAGFLCHMSIDVYKGFWQIPLCMYTPKRCSRASLREGAHREAARLT